MNIRERVLAIMKETKPTKNLENIKDIMEGGYIDSFELMTLISRLMDEFNIDITIEDMTMENFNSIDAIVAMVDSLLHQ